MEILVVIAIVIFVLLVLLKIINNLPDQEDQKKEEINSISSEYKLRRSLMTSNERVFFEILKRTYGMKYDIYPQMHLGAIFEPMERYKNWGQLSRLNKKVDFLIYNRQSQTPILGIELDDRSHYTNNKTIERDKFVELLFASHNLPLVRFNNGNYREEDLTRRIEEFLIK